MVKIVKISVDEKKRHYYKVELINHDDTMKSISIHEDVLVTKGIRKGLEMSDQEFHDLLQLESKNGAYQAAVRYLGYRMRSTKEMRDYLVKKGFDPNIMSDTITRLTKENLLNDLSFAQSYVRSKMKTMVKGPKLLFNELLQKGISENEANVALNEYPEHLQFDNALRFAEKKLSSSTATAHKDQVQKIALQLMQKGFSRSLISKAIDELPAENPDQEWDALVKQAQKAEWKLRDLDSRTKQYKLKSLLYRKGFSLALIDKYLNNNHE